MKTRIYAAPAVKGLRVNISPRALMSTIVSSNFVFYLFGILYPAELFYLNFQPLKHGKKLPLPRPSLISENS